MKVMVQGQGLVELGQREFVTAGGEGQIYRRGHTAFKVYMDPSKALPVGKIAELGRITDPQVIRPQAILIDPNGGKPIGYTMAFIERTLPLCQTFTRAFREREGLTRERMLDLVVGLRDLVQHIHDAQVLVVDVNEMNFLVAEDFGKVYAIDVDSYQTRSYRATAIMPSVRDWSVTSSANFSETSDWFSFACLAFQMLVSIHPYKGKHPKITGLEQRMRANASAFDPAVSLPRVVYPMGDIPGSLRSWLRAVLQDGKRCAPPVDLRAGVTIVVTSSANAVPIEAWAGDLEIALVLEMGEPILGYVECPGGAAVVWTAKAIDLRRQGALTAHPLIAGFSVRAVAFGPSMMAPVLVGIGGDGRLELRSAGAITQPEVQAEAVTGIGGRVHIQSGDHLLELEVHELHGGKLATTVKVVGKILGQSTKLFPGMAVQNLLGRIFLSIMPTKGTHYEVRVPELDAYRVLDARCEGQAVMVVGAHLATGRYDRLVIDLDDAFSKATVVRVISDIQPAGVNFINLGGTVVCLDEEDTIQVSKVGRAGGRTVKDPRVGGDSRLVTHQGRGAFISGNAIYSMRMKG